MQTTQQARINVVLFNGNSASAPLYRKSREGRVYVLSRAAKRMHQNLCLDDLREDEVVIAPGLIYQPLANREV